jgi:hypothetical protein
MQFIAPDILAEARELSLTILVIALLLGNALWLLGWRWHRFWVVVSITLAGGLIGLHSSRVSGGHILATGILLAVAAGLMALELARLLTFLAAGTTAWLAASLLFPGGQELWIAFLLGGLVGILLYQLCTMLATSLAGTLIASHALMCLLDRFFKIDSTSLAMQNQVMLNGAVIAVTVLGLLAQSWLERWYSRRKKRRREQAMEKIREEEREKARAEIPPPEKPHKTSLWERIFGHSRKAA